MASSGRGKRTGGKKAAGSAKKSAKKTAADKPAEVAAGKEGGAWAAVFTPRAPAERRYWLVKSEPSTFSWDDLLAAKNRTTNWDGIRNFAARNFMRDGMTLAELKTRPELAQMALLRIGRLSVTPVTAREWDVIQKMAATTT